MDVVDLFLEANRGDLLGNRLRMSGIGDTAEEIFIPFI